MAAYGKQDARSGISQNLDLDAYDAAAMMADLGPQRLKNLPLKGRVVYQSDTGPSPKKGSVQNEAIAKWSQFLEKEAEELGKKVGDDVDEDGLGLGGSYRKGPNYRPAPIHMVPKTVSRVPGPARFRAGARGAMSSNPRRPISPPRDSLLGPKPTNPTPGTARLRGQIVTRHVNTKALSRSGASNIPKGPSANHPHPSRPDPTVAVGLAASKRNTGILVSSQTLLNLKGANSKPGLITAHNAPKDSTTVPKMNVPIAGFGSQGQGKATWLQSSSLVSPALSTSTSQSGSRSSSVNQTSISSALHAIRTSNKAPRIRTRYSIRPPPEAAKNHWNLAPPTETTQQKNEVPEVVSDSIKPEAVRSPVVGRNELNSESPHIVQPEGPTPQMMTEAIKPTKVQTQPNSNQSLRGLSSSNYATPGVMSSKYASPAPPPSGLMSRKYASPAPPPGLMSSKYASPPPPPSGLMSSKYASPAPPGLMGSKYASAASPPGLMGSKYASPVVAGLSSSRYAAPNTSGSSDGNHRTPGISGLSSSKYAPGNTNATPMALGLSGSKYADPQPPPAPTPGAGAGAGLSSGTNASHQLRNPTSLETTHSPNKVVQVEVLMDAGNEKGNKNYVKSMAEKKDSGVAQTKNAKPKNKVVVDQPAQGEKQEPMQPPQRLLDSIAAKYKFATPKQVSGLARRYGTLLVADKEFPKSVSPRYREIEERSRAFQALFISRGQRVMRHPELLITHKVSS